MRIVDLFAGPGGWDQGLSDLGFDGTVVGLEWDGDACDTAMAAGHLRVQADVAQYPTEPFHGWDGLIASPPCQAFSMAGKGDGRRSIGRLLEHVSDCVDGWIDPPSELCAEDVRADLSLQPLRWAWEVKPRWIACEQVPAVLPLWEAMCEVLWQWGYEADARILNAADFGVPQTRRRAFLLARTDGPVVWPEATHFDARKGMSLFGLPWVTMADAIGYGPLDRPSPTVTGGGADTGGYEPFGSWGRKIVLDRRTNSRDGRGVMVPTVPVPMDRPAPTVTGSGVSGQWVWRELPEWCHERPATTVVGSFRPDIIAGPGYRKAGDGPRQDAPGSVCVTIHEAGVLQSFPPDYPWQGTKGSQGRQCGNAVPPGLAAAVLRRLTRPA